MFLEIIKSHCFSQLDLLRVFLRYAFSETICVVVFRAISELAQVFSLFIPLKILIIMGSQKIPVYFDSYITEETKTFWLFSLIITTFLIYAVSIFFGMLSHRYMTKAFSRFDVLQTHSDDGNKNIRQEVKRVHKFALNGYTNLLIILIGLLIALFLQPLIVLIMMVFIVLQTMFVNHLFGINYGYMTKLGRSIMKEPADYLNYFAAINFLLVFTLLALGYVLTGQLNTMGAILTLLLSRRVFQALKQYGVIALKLSDEEESVTYFLRLR